jgi:hypothetical protein
MYMRVTPAQTPRELLGGVLNSGRAASNRAHLLCYGTLHVYTGTLPLIVLVIITEDCQVPPNTGPNIIVITFRVIKVLSTFSSSFPFVNVSLH